MVVHNHSNQICPPLLLPNLRQLDVDYGQCDAQAVRALPPSRHSRWGSLWAFAAPSLASTERGNPRQNRGGRTEAEAVASAAYHLG